MLRKILCSLVFCFILIGSNSQSPFMLIDSINVYSYNQSIPDSNIIVAFTTHPNQNSYFDKQVVFKNDTTISIYSCWHSGQLPSSEKYIDTIFVGSLTPHSYKIVYYLKFLRPWEIDSFDACITNPYYDSAFIYHTVQSPSNSPNLGVGNLPSSLHPNPASTYINISGAEPNATTIITNLHGQVLLQSEILNAQPEISVEALTPGFYFCILQSRQESKVLRFVKQ